MIQNLITSEIQKHLSGHNTVYKGIIEGVRQVIQNHHLLNKETISGAIVFLERSQDNDLNTRVFPIIPEAAIFSENIPLSADIKEEIALKITQPKKYTEFWHFQWFRENANDPKHFHFQLPVDEVQHYESWNSEKWNKFAKDIGQNKISKNTLEQFLLPSGTDSIVLIPLPVLSTPTIFIVLDSRCVPKGEQGTRFKRSLYFRTRNFITGYIYSRLIRSLEESIGSINSVPDEQTLLKNFITEYAHVLIPISFRVFDHSISKEILNQKYWPLWPEPDESVAYDLDLLIDHNTQQHKYSVTFYLTSFVFPDLDGNDSSYANLSRTEYFKSSQAGAAGLSAILFDVFHKFWIALRKNEKHYLRAKLESALSPIASEIEQTKEALTLALKVIEKSSASLNERVTHLITDNEPVCGIRITGNHVTIRYNNQEIFSNICQEGRLRGAQIVQAALKKLDIVKRNCTFNISQLFKRHHANIEDNEENLIPCGYKRNGRATHTAAELNVEGRTQIDDEYDTFQMTVERLVKERKGVNSEQIALYKAAKLILKESEIYGEKWRIRQKFPKYLTRLSEFEKLLFEEEKAEINNELEEKLKFNSIQNSDDDIKPYHIKDGLSSFAEAIINSGKKNSELQKSCNLLIEYLYAVGIISKNGKGSTKQELNLVYKPHDGWNWDW